MTVTFLLDCCSHRNGTIPQSTSTHQTNMSAISRQQKTKGEGFIIEAEKTLAKKTWFASSTESKHEDAAELYEKAANAFKVGGCHAQAGDAYSKAAELHRDQLKQLGEASKCLSSAGEFWVAHAMCRVSCFRCEFNSDAMFLLVLND